ANWSHSAVVESRAHVIEAEAGGIVRSPISKYRKDEYHLVRLDGEIDAAGRERATAYAKSRLGEGFGYLDMLGLAIYLLAGRRGRLGRGGHRDLFPFAVRPL